MCVRECVGERGREGVEGVGHWVRIYVHADTPTPPPTTSQAEKEGRDEGEDPFIKARSKDGLMIKTERNTNLLLDAVRGYFPFLVKLCRNVVGE